jgi:hypothetical protein
MKKCIFTLSLLVINLFTGSVLAQGLDFSDDVNDDPFNEVIKLDGYAWSATMGWISMNCDQTEVGGISTCADSAYAGTKVNYHVEIETNGLMSGHAWSSNAGWIKFGGLSGFPPPADADGVADVSAKAVGTYPNLALTGWARACAGATNPATCSGGLNINAGGWDGWIALAGTGYDITFVNGEAENSATSYAWGGPNTMGWIDFSPSSASTPVRLQPNTDIEIIGINYTPGIADDAGYYNMTALANVVGIPDGETVPYTLSVGSASSVGTVTQTASGPDFSPALRLSGVPFNTTDPLVLEVDMPAPGNVAEVNEVNVYSRSLSTLSVPPPTMLISSVSGADVVRAGDMVEVEWMVSALYPVTCTVRGPGISETVVVNGSVGASDSTTDRGNTDPLQNAARVELSCTVGTDVYTEVLQLEVIPTFQEI